jgi:5-methylcytosine-specific restriction endonuclease McrA
MHIYLTPQALAIIVLIVLGGIILLRLSSRVRRRTRRQGPSRARIPRWRGRRGSGSTVARRSRDHGATVARKHGHERSPEWPRVAHEHLSIEPACAACGHRGQGLQVHHIKPFHLFPELELDPNNLITLCELKGRDHHLLLGHLDDWESYNPNVRRDVKRFHNENAQQIRANPAWEQEMEARPHPSP